MSIVSLSLSIDTRTTEIYTLSLHDALPISFWQAQRYPWKLVSGGQGGGLFKSTDGGEHWTEITHNPGLPAGVRSEEHTSELQSRGQLVCRLLLEKKNSTTSSSGDRRRTAYR